MSRHSLVSGSLSCFQFEAFSGLNICVLPISLRASQVVLVVKNLPANVGEIRDVGWIPGLGRSPGEGNGNPLQYSCLDNPMDRGNWQAIVHEVTKSWIQLSD